MGTCLYYLSKTFALVYGKLLRFQILDHIALAEVKKKA